MLNTEEMERLKGLAAEVADHEGCLIYDLEFAGTAAGRTLRVFIDKPDGHVSLEDCASVSRALNLKLDADEDLIPGGAYNLEVSTPGLDRALREPWHFKGVLGKTVWIKSRESMISEGVRKQVTGRLKEADEGGVVVETDGAEFSLAYSNIEKAKLVFEMNTAGKPKAKKKK